MRIERGEYMKNWKAIMQVAATYIGTVVGAGFASGQEILQFFTIHGIYGSIAIVISTILFIWLGCKIMSISQRHQFFSFKDFNYHLFGKKLGLAFNVLTMLILFGTTGVMLSGAGSIFYEQFGIATQIGILITVGLTIIVLNKGMDGILWVNSLIVPMMLLFTLILALHMTETYTHALPSLDGAGLAWLRSAFLYAGFNLAMAQAVLVPLGREINNTAVIKWGGIWGGLGLGVMLMVSHFALWVDYTTINMLDIPLAQLISDFGRWTVILFAVVVYGEIFTTIIGNVFGLARQIQSIWKVTPLFATVLILFGSFLLSQWGFRNLVSSLYPLFGIVGLIFIFRIAVYINKKTT